MAVIYTIFAGREKYLRCQIPYLLRLLRDGTIDRVDVWDFCATSLDREFCRGACDVCGFSLHDGTSMLHEKLLRWRPYYEHYNKTLRDDDVIIKADDDIVYIHNLAALVHACKLHPSSVLFPQIINNDVMVKLQQELGILTDLPWVLPDLKCVQMRKTEQQREMPLTALVPGSAARAGLMWWRKSECANYIHDRFTRDPERFPRPRVLQWTDPLRVSINCMCMSGATFRRATDAYLPLSMAVPDEPFFSYMWQRQSGATNYAVMDSVVVHYQFGIQKDISVRFLRTYRAWADELMRQNANFGVRLPSEGHRHKLIVGTPTGVVEPARRLEFTERLARTLSQAGDVHWVVCSGSGELDHGVSAVLRNSGIPHSYITSAGGTMHSQRNAILRHVRTTGLEGVLYFGELHYRLVWDIFDILSRTDGIGVFPVGHALATHIDQAVVEDGAIVGWCYHAPGNKYDVNDAGIAYHTRALGEATWPEGGHASAFLDQLIAGPHELQPFFENAREPFVYYNDFLVT